MKIAYLPVAFALLVSVPALALPTKLTVAGKVTSITTLINDQYVDNPASKFSVNDNYSLTAIFDLATAQLTPYYDLDPTINIYNLPSTSVSYTIGAYNRSFSPTDYNSSIQLWNDYNIFGGTDAQSFLFYDSNISPGEQAPFNVNSGPQSVSIVVGNFDYTATARTNDLLTQMMPFSAFGSKLLTLSQYDPLTQTAVLVDLSISSESLSSAVPESASWIMILIGFGIAGTAMRQSGILKNHTLNPS